MEFWILDIFSCGELYLDRTIHNFSYVELYMNRTIHTCSYDELNGSYDPYLSLMDRTVHIISCLQVVYSPPDEQGGGSGGR